MSNIDWTGFYIGLGVFVVACVLGAGLRARVAAWMERVEWSACGRNESMW